MKSGKSRFRGSILFIIAFMVCLALPLPSKAASSATVKKAYIRFLTEKISSNAYYAIKNVGQNNTPVLLIGVGEKEKYGKTVGFAECKAYYYTGGKVKCADSITSLFGPLYICKKGSQSYINISANNHSSSFIYWKSNRWFAYFYDSNPAVEEGIYKEKNQISNYCSSRYDSLIRKYKNKEIIHFEKNRYASQKESIKLNKTSATIYTSGSKTVQLKATVTGKSKKVKWKSSNSKIATVNSSGKITGKKAGTCTITAKANGKTAKCKVTVKKPSIKLNKSSATIYTSGITSIQLKATVKGESPKITWRSSNKKIAAVNSRGKVTAKKTGTVTITAKANGKIAKCKVTVKKETNYEKLLKKDMTTEQVAKVVGCKFDYTDPAEGITSYKNVSKSLMVSCSDSAEKIPGEWSLSTDGKVVSICGIKVGINMSEANSKLASGGWKKYRRYGSPSWGYRIVHKKGDFLLYYSTDQQTIDSISYSPYTGPLV